MHAPELSVGGGGAPSVPSRISVVLVEEVNAGGTPRLGCPRDDQNIRLLVGVAKPASVTVCEDSLGSPCVGGTLSSSDIDDIEVTNAPELSGWEASVGSLTNFGGVGRGGQSWGHSTFGVST